MPSSNTLYAILTSCLLWMPSNALAAVGDRVEVEGPGLPETEAQLVRIRGDALDLELPDGTPRRIQTAEIGLVSFPDHLPSNSEATFLVTLIDGTTIGATSIETVDERLRIARNTLEKLPPVEIPLPVIVGVQLRTLNVEQSAAWQAILDSTTPDDLLAVQRDEDGPITKLGGIIGTIANQSVSFDFGGSSIDVGFDRLAGIKFFTREAMEIARPSVAVHDIFGNQFQTTQIRSISADGSEHELELSLCCGAEIKIPLRAISRIDYSVGTARYLADLEPLQRSSPPRFNFGDGLAGNDLFGAHPFKARQISGKPVGPGIEFLGQGDITYRIPDGYSALKGSIELRPRGEIASPCNVQIIQEQEVLWERSLEQTRERIDFELAVEADSRLRLVVNATSKLPSGDVVVWHEVRLVK